MRGYYEVKSLSKWSCQTIFILDCKRRGVKRKICRTKEAQYIKQWCVNDYKAEPTFDGSEEIELY